MIHGKKGYCNLTKFMERKKRVKTFPIFEWEQGTKTHTRYMCLHYLLSTHIHLIATLDYSLNLSQLRPTSFPSHSLALVTFLCLFIINEFPACFYLFELCNILEIAQVLWNYIIYWNGLQIMGMTEGDSFIAEECLCLLQCF